MAVGPPDGFHVAFHAVDRLLGCGGAGLLHLLLAHQGQHAGSRKDDQGDDEGGEPRRQRQREREHGRGDHGPEPEDGQYPSTTEQARAQSRMLRLVGHLGLRQRDLITNQLRALLRQRGQQLPDGWLVLASLLWFGHDILLLAELRSP
jgi:hypothetical protein